MKRKKLLIAALIAVLVPSLYIGRWWYRKTKFDRFKSNFAERTLDREVETPNHTGLEQVVSAPEPLHLPRNGVVGQNFYTDNPTRQFINRLSGWLRYLDIEDLFPNLEEMRPRIIEVGHQLREAGDDSYLGLADKELNTVLIRPKDFATLLHEATHINPEYKGSLLSTEVGSFALQLHATGDYEGVLETLASGSNYDAKDKRRGRIIAEASIVLGRGIFDYLREAPENISSVKLASQLKELMVVCDSYFIDTNKTAKDYLMQCHGLTPFVSDYLLNLTEDRKDTIIRSTTKSKKEVIGAFKTLVSFYSINLGYTLEQAIARTEQHFEDYEALSIHKTLSKGAKDVFAKMHEYGYEPEMCRGICSLMVSQGASKARAYAKGLPSFIELTGNYGPRGERLMQFALKNPNFFDVMTLSDASQELLNLADVEPEQVPMFLDELAQYDWTLDMVTRSSVSIAGQYNSEVNTLKSLSQREKAAMVALSFYLSVLDEKYHEELTEEVGEYVHDSVGYNFGSLRAGMASSGRTIYEIADAVTKRLQKPLPDSGPPKTLYQGLKEIEERGNMAVEKMKAATENMKDAAESLRLGPQPVEEPLPVPEAVVK